MAERPRSWKWHNEEQWLISEIAGSIAALAMLARHPAQVSAEDIAARDPHLRLLAWQGGRYLETQSDLKDHDLNVEIEDYKR